MKWTLDDSGYDEVRKAYDLIGGDDLSDAEFWRRVHDAVEFTEYVDSLPYDETLVRENGRNLLIDNDRVSEVNSDDAIVILHVVTLRDMIGNAVYENEKAVTTELESHLKRVRDEVSIARDEGFTRGLAVGDREISRTRAVFDEAISHALNILNEKRVDGNDPPATSMDVKKKRVEEILQEALKETTIKNE